MTWNVRNSFMATVVNVGEASSVIEIRDEATRLLARIVRAERRVRTADTQRIRASVQDVVDTWDPGHGFLVDKRTWIVPWITASGRRWSNDDKERGDKTAHHSMLYQLKSRWMIFRFRSWR